VLKEHRVEGLLRVAWEKQVEQTTQYVGRGRGSLSRAKRVMQKTRYHLTHIARQEDTIAARRQRVGWKAFVTNAGPKRLSLRDAVLGYRNEYPRKTPSPLAANVLAGKLLSPMRGQSGCLCGMRCWAIVTNIV